MKMKTKKKAFAHNSAEEKRHNVKLIKVKKRNKKKPLIQAQLEWKLEYMCSLNLDVIFERDAFYVLILCGAFTEFSVSFGKCIDHYHEVTIHDIYSRYKIEYNNI